MAITRDGANYFVYDGAGVTPGAGCTGGGSTATCSGSGVTSILVDVRVGNDSVDLGDDGPGAVTIPARIDGGEGNDSLSGGAGNDRISPGNGADFAEGDGGDDVLVNFHASGSVPADTGDTYDGGDGTDWIEYVASEATQMIRLDGLANDGVGDWVTSHEGDNVLATVENVESIGFNNADLIVGNSASNNIRAGGGVDRVEGGPGDDVLDGGDGHDRVEGGPGDDVIYGGADSYEGSSNDMLLGDAGADELHGHGGGDTLDGGSGSDVLNGGNGDDRLTGGALTCPFGGCAPSMTPADTISGGPGADTVDYSTYTAALTVDLAGGYAGAGGTRNDVLSEISNVIGGSGPDQIAGDDFPNSLSGGPGADTLNGRGGPDGFDGGAGSDTVDSRDDQAESPTCGPDTDVLRRDRQDTAGDGCEAYTPRLTGTLSIGGTTTEGQTLTASASWEAAPAPAHAYQWRRCNASGTGCVNIDGATASTYGLSAPDVGARLRVVVSATNSAGSDSEESGATAQIARAAPVNTALPTVSGTPRRGSTLAASPGTWKWSETPAYAYQWERCPPIGSCSAIPGATASTYGVVLADVDQTLRVVVTATNSGGSGSSASERTGVISDLDTNAPDTTITSGPPPSTTDRSASFTFSANEAGSTFQCSLDGAAFSPCTSPASYSGLAVGARSFQVRATDSAGNTDATPAQANWTITAPAVVLCKVPKLAGKTLAQAKAALTKANCRLGKVTKAYSAKVKKGRVIKQSPGVGRTLAKGAKVNVVLSRGKRR